MSTRNAPIVGDSFQVGYRFQRYWDTPMANAFFFGELGAVGVDPLAALRGLYCCRGLGRSHVGRRRAGTEEDLHADEREQDRDHCHDDSSRPAMDGASHLDAVQAEECGFVHQADSSGEDSETCEDSVDCSAVR